MSGRLGSALALVAALASAQAACVAVHPWERGDLARWCMRAPGDARPVGRYHHKLIETRTAASTAGTAPGGGCGCSQ